MTDILLSFVHLPLTRGSCEVANSLLQSSEASTDKLLNFEYLTDCQNITYPMLKMVINQPTTLPVSRRWSTGFWFVCISLLTLVSKLQEKNSVTKYDINI